MKKYQAITFCRNCNNAFEYIYSKADGDLAIPFAANNAEAIQLEFINKIQLKRTPGKHL